MEHSADDPTRPSEESVRLAALEASGLLDSPAEAEFDRLTALVSRVLHAPVALISLVDRDRQFFKSHIGLSEPLASRRETPLTHSFCRFVAASGQPLVISDARENPLVRKNPAVSEFDVIAYAGMPVSDGQGHVLGALCAIDGQPRTWTDEELEILRALAAQANTEISLRARARRQATENGWLRDAARLNVHDLHGPLDAIILGVQALGYMGDWNDAQRECAEICVRDGKELRARIDELLDIANIGQAGGAAMLLAECPPHYVLATAAERATPAAADRGVAILIDAAPDVPSFPMDAEKITRVLDHLIERASRFTPSGGAVRLTAESSPPNQPRSVILTVTDGGRGEPLPDAPGPRAGLDFCEHVAAAHGGRLFFRGTAGDGGAFSITLPVSPGPGGERALAN